jgi:phage gp36-like protein
MYFTQEELEQRLGPTAVKRIYDDKNTGTADASALDRVTRDATAIVDAAIESIYDLPLAEPYPDRVVCLALDAAEYLAARRHPEYVKRDWRVLKEELERDLDRLRTQKRSMGRAPPDPAANQGGAVYPTPDPTNQQNVPIFLGGAGKWGIF